MKAKILEVGTHVLEVLSNGGFMTIKNLAVTPNTTIFNAQVFVDIIEFEDVAIDASGNAIFVVRRKKDTFTPGIYDSVVPPIKYGVTETDEIFETRAINAFVTLP